MQPYILKTDGSQEPIKETINLEVLQKAVGGCIEIVRICNSRATSKYKGLLMVVNENGIGENLPFNQKANNIYEEAFDCFNPTGILGNVVICNDSDID